MNQKKDVVIDERFFRHDGEYVADANLHIERGAKFNSLKVDGNLTVGENICVRSIVVQGDVIVNGNISVEDIRVGGNLKVNGNLSIEGDMYVKGDCKIGRFAPSYSNVFIGGKFDTEAVGLSSRIHRISVGYPVVFPEEQ